MPNFPVHSSYKMAPGSLARWSLFAAMIFVAGILSSCSSDGGRTGSLVPFWESGDTVASSQQTSTSQTARAGGPTRGRPVPPAPGALSATQGGPQAQPKAPSTIKVAILVPLSGPNAELGQAMVDAAQLAVFDLAPQNFEIMPRDTGDTEEQAVSAARDALADGASLILGPLFSGAVTAIKPYAARAGIDVLAFSNDASLAGGGVYVLGFTPAAQVERIVGYAKSQGYLNLAALIPQSPYGATIDQSLLSATSLNGLMLAATPHYDVSTGQMRDNIDAAIRELPPAGGYDALLLPEGGNRLMALAQQLALHNVSVGPNHGQVRLLGTGLWDEPGLGHEAALIGGWYAAPDPNSRANFEKHFTDTYGHTPPRLATLSYDATALAAVIAKNGWLINATTLTNPNGFTGADGLFRLRANGIAERGLAVLEVTPTGSRVVDPAPRTFAPPGATHAAIASPPPVVPSESGQHMFGH